jgi:hypothetical protein
LAGEVSGSSKKYLLLAGFFAGLAFYSKYTSVFLLFGAFMYILIYRREWFRLKELYLSVILATLFFIPVLLWNYNNDFISFAYQGERVDFFGSGLRADLFFTELGGQILYNNPLNFFLGVLAIIALLRRKLGISRDHGLLILWTSLPLILIFLFFALFRGTLPHWTGPAWTSIILLSAVFLRDAGIRRSREKLVPGIVSGSLGVLTLVIVLGLMQIKGGMLYYDAGDKDENLGEKDISLDMYGWRQLSVEFERIITAEKELENIKLQSPVISHRWFPAANIDYYLARPLGINVLGLGSLDGIHKYAWMNDERGGFSKGMDAWYITVSRDFRDPLPMYGTFFSKVELAYTIPVKRNGKHVLNAFVYYMKDMKKLPGTLLEK